ncbi:MAG: YceI family protein [Armatimonadetes bacterium]|nr:YceI family protein [Armatimonadota bacterium]
MRTGENTPGLTRLAVRIMTHGSLRWASALATVALLAAGAGAQVLATGTFLILPGESRAEFFVADNRGGFTGYTTRVSGTVKVHQLPDGTFNADVQATVDARTITTGIGLRDRQMHRDVLKTEAYPVMAFRGSVTLVAVTLGRPLAARVRGRLTVRDASREVDFPARILALRDEYVGEGEFVVRMSEFGIPVPRFLVFVAQDPVQVRVKVVARHQ